MFKYLPTALLSLFHVMSVGMTSLLGAETFTAVDLVTADVAFCFEVAGLNETWTRFEAGPYLDRLRTFPPFQRLLESGGFHQWQAVEEHVARLTGTKLSFQLRELFGRSLVLAIYVPQTGNPRGILIGEAIDHAAVQTALATWNKLEPHVVLTRKSHHGHGYLQRKKQAPSVESAFIAMNDRWFAVSDNESLIQEVIDRFVSLTSETSQSSTTDTLPTSPRFVQNRRRLKTDGLAYLHINARPWDRGLEESSQGSNDPINIAEIWKRVNSVTACLRLDDGIVCDAVLDLETSRLPGEWTKLVATAAGSSSWIDRIPAESLLAISGRIELAPVLQYLFNQIPAKDQVELMKIRRIVQSQFGGEDLLDSILPALARNFGGFVTTRIDKQTNKGTLDGALGFSLGAVNDHEMLNDIEHGLDFGLSLLAAYHSVEGDRIVTVQREQNEAIQLHSLSMLAPFPIAFGIKGSNLVIAGSPDQLKQSIQSLNQPVNQSRLADHKNRFFSDANQLLWLDTARLRHLFERHGTDIAQIFAPNSANEASRLAQRFEQARHYLQLIDSAFVAGRIESDHIRITFGGGLDTK
jgi:hypothetical protein